MKPVAGVYKIENISNGDMYIGSADDIVFRLKRHHQQLTCGKHCNRHLQFAWNKYGKQVFNFATVLLCDTENKLYYEQILIDGLKPAYNLALDVTAPMQGRHHSNETCAMMSGENHPNFGKHISEEIKRKISEGNKGNTNWLGKHHTEETKRKISEAEKGKVISVETRANMSKAQKASTNNNLGKRFTEEHKRKISSSQKLRWQDRKAMNLEDA